MYEAELAEAERRFLARPSRAEDTQVITELSGRIAQLEYQSTFVLRIRVHKMFVFCDCGCVQNIADGEPAAAA
jgi:hypothetical protein